MCAIEDAEALAFTLRSVQAGSVHAVLQCTFCTRYKRCCECQTASRAEGLDGTLGLKATKGAFERWTYPGAEKWMALRPDTVLEA
jgi:hypothetical protein